MRTHLILPKAVKREQGLFQIKQNTPSQTRYEIFQILFPLNFSAIQYGNKLFNRIKLFILNFEDWMFRYR